MSQTPPEAGPRTGAIDWEDPSSLPVGVVRDLFLTLSKALRSYQLYDRDNPVYLRFVENLRDAFRRIWETRDQLQVLVEEDRFVWMGEEVYREETRSGSLAFLLYRDGIRDLTFRRGVEGDELEILLDVLHRVRSARQEEDDLVTLLWDLNLDQLDYSAVDLLPEGTLLRAPDDPDPSALDIREILEGELGDEAPGGEVGRAVSEATALDDLAAIRPEDFNPTLYALDERERSYLEEEFHKEMGRDVRTDVLNALFDRLEDREYARKREEEILDAIHQLLPTFLAQGSLRHAALLLSELEKVRRRPQALSEEGFASVEELMEEFSSPESVRELVQSVEGGTVDDDGESLALLLRHLKPRALGPLLARAEEVTRPEARQLIQRAIRKLAEGEEERLARFLSHSDDQVVAGAVRLMGALRHRPAVPTLVRLLEEGSPPIQEAVLDAARRIPTTAMAEAVERCLVSESRDLRIGAARVLAEISYTPAAASLRTLVEDRDMREADITEKLAFFQAYADLAGEDAIGLLARILNHRGFLGRREPPEMRACGALALGRVGTARAIQEVERARDDDEAVVRTAVKRVLTRRDEEDDRG